MKFPPAPILVLLALGGGCALAPPSHSGQGGSTGSTTHSSAGGRGSGGVIPLGGTTSADPPSGGYAVQPDAGVLVTAGTTTAGGATSTGSTAGSSPAGGTTSGTTAAGGNAFGGGSASGGASGGNASGGISARGGTFTGGSMSGGTFTGGSMSGGTSTGGSMSGGSKSGGTRTAGATASGGASGGSATGGSASGGTSTSAAGTHASYPPITNGTNGFATRYWDCCKPSCGWSANANGKPVHTCGKDGTSTVGNDTQSACGGGGGYMCYWGAPWSVSNTLSFGFAAYNGVDCGTCFQIQFTGKGQYNDKDPGSMALSGKTMIVQVINIGGIAANQFDLLIPGGGVGANNACTGGSAQWSGANIGDTNGGMLTSCKDSGSCVSQMCQSAFGNMPQLLAGCNWVTGWFASADNPQMVYQKIACPPEISAKSGE
jgi:hypothetical protein